MSLGLVLQTKAVKVVNKGGGVQWRRSQEIPGRMNGKKDSGSDYVVFVCENPRCRNRNKCSMYEAEGYIPANENRIPFKCRICRTVHEVEPPTTKNTQSLIITPDEFQKDMAQRRRSLAGHH